MRRVKYVASSDGLMITISAVVAMIYLGCIVALGWVAFHYAHKYW